MKPFSTLVMYVTLLVLPAVIGGFQEPGIDLATFSGNWRGTMTIIQTGNCTINGTDSVSIPSNMSWRVDSFGSITIVDSVFMNTNWEGKIEPDSSVVLGKGFWVDCVFQAPHYEMVEYSGRIADTLGFFQLTVETTEEWCPAPQSCLFRVRYFLAKEKAVTSVDDYSSDRIPRHFDLAQNYPNPFNPETTIHFSLPKGSHVEISIYNTMGQTIRRLVHAEYSAGTHWVQWDGRDDSGAKAASGVYLYRLQAGEFSQVRKMSLIR